MRIPGKVFGFVIDYFGNILQTKRPTPLVCNRCGHVQVESSQCDICGWGDLYPQKK